MLYKDTLTTPQVRQRSRLLKVVALVLGLFVGGILMVYVPPQEFTVVYQLTVLLFAVAMILGLYALGNARAKLNKQTLQNQILIEQLSKHYEHAIENARVQADTDALYKRTIEQLLAVLDAIEEGLILINQEGVIAIANPRMTLLDISPLRLISHSVSQLLEDKSLQLYKALGFTNQWEVQEIIACLKANVPWKDQSEYHYSFMVGGKLRHFSRQILPVRDELGRVIGILLAFHDQTQAQELEHAREQLTRMIVHDLRSPLTAVMTGFKVINDLVPSDAPQRDTITSVLDNSKQALDKLLGRVDTLLDIAKLEDGKFGLETEPTSLIPLIENVTKELTPMAQEIKIQIQTEIGGDLPLVKIDADKIERLLLNLVDNALKYSPTGSTIHIKAYVTNPPEVKVNGIITHFVRLEVSDEGIGIPEDAREMLFDSFAQVQGRKSVRRGVGLGLAFCKLVAVAHGGDIWIEENKPQGSRFIVKLPSAQMELPDELEMPTNPVQLIPKPKTEGKK